MIKYQAIIDLWNSWGRLIDRPNDSNPIQTAIELDIVISKLTLLCISTHDLEMSDVISEYIRRGWIQK